MKVYVLSAEGIEIGRFLANASVTEEQVVEFAEATTFSHTVEMEITLSGREVRALQKLVEPKEYPSFKKQQPQQKFGGYMKHAKRQRW